MSKEGAYIPDRGDLIWIVLDPRMGHEQSGRRPAIVMSKRLFSERTGLAVICPITSKVKGLPFEIRIKNSSVDGSILPIRINLFQTFEDLEAIKDKPADIQAVRKILDEDQ